MAFLSVTYTFSNGSTADATQVNQNFTDVQNALSDGTKSLNISAITAAGVVTLNGAVALGASTGNTITWNGSLGSSINIGSNTTYDIGGSTFGLRSIYFGSGGSNTTRLLAGTNSSITFTLPISTGVTGQSIITDGSGVLSCRYPDKVLSSTTAATYTATGSETVIPISASSNPVTITLPQTTAVPFKRYLLTRTDNTAANAVTITPNAADSINFGTTGTSVTLQTTGELLEIVSDNVSNWIVVQRYTTTNWTSYTPTFSAGFGTCSGVAFKYRRVGDSIEVMGYFKCGTTAGSAATISLPNSATWAIDTGKIPGTAHNQCVVGYFNNSGSGAQAPFTTTSAGMVIVDTKTPTTSAVALSVNIQTDGNADFYTVANASSIFNTNGQGSVRFTVPIVNWVA